MEKYTTLDIKKNIAEDKDKTLEEKEKENKKVVISNDAFALYEILERLRLSFLK